MSDSKFHSLVKDGHDHFLKDGTPVKAIVARTRGVLTVVLPDHYDEAGNPVGHGGSIDLRDGDYLVGRPDGSIFGVKKDEYNEYLSKTPPAVPFVLPHETKLG